MAFEPIRTETSRMKAEHSPTVFRTPRKRSALADKAEFAVSSLRKSLSRNPSLPEAEQLLDVQRYPLLGGVHDPADLRSCDQETLRGLADEARTFLLETIGRSGGHLGAALGAAELTVALFHEFDFLRDRIAWDVGHQAHVYKLLTGRANQFARYGMWGGLCKFLDRRESPFDHMGAGHASTSISAALGMALARDQRGEEHHVLAVIGDGAMTGGLAYEALHLAGAMELNLTVILNDNGMSIDQNVGFCSRAVTQITASQAYNAVRQELKRIGAHMPYGTEFLEHLKRLERSLKDHANRGDHAALFEALGFHYFGPVDGHNLEQVISLLRRSKQIRGPLLLHLATVKGKGMGVALENTFDAHAVSPPASPKQGAVAGKTWTAVYAEGLDALMAEDPHIVAITAAMKSNTGLARLEERYPGRVIDVGIAEANAYCSAAGMAIGGLKPFVTVYSTFSQRAFDQLIHDIALQNLPVRIMLDRGGFVGADGPTHHGVFDYSYLRLIPNLVHMAPRDELELRRMLLTAHAHQDGPIAMRYPRGDTPRMRWAPEELKAIPIGQGELLREAPSGCLLLVAVGSMVQVALATKDVLEAQQLPVAVIDARFIKPLDEDLLRTWVGRASCVITLEENVLAGGFGEGVLSWMASAELLRPTRMLGAPDRFIDFGSHADQLRAAGLSHEQITSVALQLWRRTGPLRAVRGRKPA